MFRQRRNFGLFIPLSFLLSFFSFQPLLGDGAATNSTGVATELQTATLRGAEIAAERARIEKELKKEDLSDEKRKELETDLKKTIADQKANQALIDGLKDRINRLQAKDSGGPPGGGSGGGGGGEEKGGGAPPPPPPPPPPPGGDKGGGGSQPQQQQAQSPPPLENPLSKLEKPKDDKELAKVIEALTKKNEATTSKATETAKKSSPSQIADITAAGKKGLDETVNNLANSLNKPAQQSTQVANTKKPATPKTNGQKIQDAALASTRGNPGGSRAVKSNASPSLAAASEGDEGSDEKGLTPVGKRLSLKSQKAFFSQSAPASNVPLSPHIIPSLYELCSKSPGCMITK